MIRLLTRSPIALAAVLILGSALSAQRTWVVDAGNGAGTDFTDLPPAFTAVKDGDRVLVRAGKYTPAKLDKAISLVAAQGSIVQVGTTSLEVTGIAAGKVCVIQGLEMEGGFSYPHYSGLHVHDNQGLIVLGGLRLELIASMWGLRVQNCKAVSLTGSIVRPGISVENSELAVTGCQVAPFSFPIGAVAVGVTAYNSRLEFTQCLVWGYSGDGHAPATWAMRLYQCEAVLRGDARSSYTGGRHPQYQAASIDGFGNSTLVVDPAVVMTPPPVNLLSIVTRRMPALTARGGAAGQTLDLELYSPARDPYVLAVAMPTVPFQLPFGRQWLDVSTEIFLAFAVQGSSEHALHSYPVPNNPALTGLPLGFQAASGTGAGFALSNPVVPVLH